MIDTEQQCLMTIHENQSSFKFNLYSSFIGYRKSSLQQYELLHVDIIHSIEKCVFLLASKSERLEI